MNEIIKQIRNRVSSFNKDKITDDIDTNVYNFIESEIEQCNLFIKHNNMDKNLKNLLWAFKSTIMMMLFRPTLSWDDETNGFIFNRLKTSSQITSYMSNHIPLFISFDNNRIPSDSWSVYDISKEEVKILLKVDYKITGKKTILKLFQDAVSQARNEGWEGTLLIITLSSLLTKI